MNAPQPFGTRLTKAQLDLWIAHQVFPDPAVLNVPFAVEVHVALDPAALTAAFHTLVRSADMLRLRIRMENASPEMCVLDREDATLEVVDLRHMTAGAHDEWMRTRASRPFALDGRLWDAALLQLPGDRSVIYLNQHHITTDVWSQRLLFNKWSELYEQASSGDLPERVPLRPFVDYAEFARDLRDSAEYLRAEEFWKGQLASPPPAPALYGRSVRSGSAGGFRVSRSLGAGRTEAISGLAEALGGRSINRARLAVLVSLFAVLQHRVSGADEISIGVPYHNRPEEFRETVGLFVNVVPVRIAVAGEMSFQSIATAVARDLDLALAHARVPIAQSMTAPVYHSSVNYHVLGSSRFAGYPAKQTVMFSGRVDEPLALMIEREPASGELVVSFDCDEELFAPPRDRRVVEHFLAIADACTGDPSAPIDAAELATADERRLILAWAGADRRSAAERTTGALSGILAKMRDMPGAVAIREGEETISYAELRSRTARLAAVLLDRGVTRDRPVGVMMPRSADALCAALAVLWAGGAYVPIDPGWPESRRALIARDLDLACILTGGEATPLSREAEPASRDAEQLAYVIYTSGSTGEPKGVAICDGSLVSHCRSIVEFLGMTASDRVVQFHALTFDASIEEIFPPLFAGASVLIRPADAIDPILFNEFVETSGATILELPTSFWHEWVHAVACTGRRVPANVRLAFVGGEQPSSAALRDWWRIAPHARWANGYGPTETTVTSTAISPELGDVPDPIPMGRPLRNETAYVLDRWRHLVPIGVPGELHIGGAGVARGYVNRPELTAERFINDPRLGDRVYRTGDVARYTDAGALEYLGRRDEQVKVRGYRIELPEIEYALARHPAVTHSAVLVRDHEGHRRLVAYFVANAPVRDADLRGFLRSSLPEYMVPSTFVQLERFPLTAHGKVDKRALPAFQPLQRPPEMQPAALTFNPIQAELVTMWERLLNVQGITPDDSFVALGGDSLIAARIISDIEQLFGRRLPLATMFPDVTIARLTAALRDAAAESFADPVRVFNEHGARPPLMYFHGDYGGGGLYTTRLAKMLGPNQPVIVVHPFGVDSRYVPPTFEEMARRRIDAAVSAHPSDEYFVGGFCNGGLVALEVARLLRARGIRVRGLALIDSVLNTRRFRALAAVMRAWSRIAGDTAYRARERFLSWRDRQQAIADLLALPGGRRDRFNGLADRIRFIYGSVARKLVRSSASAPAPRDVDVVGPKELWKVYERVMNAYAPVRYSGSAVLLISEETAPLRMSEEWSPVISDVHLVQLPGHHYGVVTEHLPVVARVLSELMNAENPELPATPDAPPTARPVVVTPRMRLD